MATDPRNHLPEGTIIRVNQPPEGTLIRIPDPAGWRYCEDPACPEYAETAKTCATGAHFHRSPSP